MSLTRWCGAPLVIVTSTMSPGRTSAPPVTKWTSRLSRARPVRRDVSPSFLPLVSATSSSTVAPSSRLFSSYATSLTSAISRS